MLQLNHEARLYGWWPLNSIGRDVNWVPSLWRERPEPLAAGADVKITINVVDTGERRQVGSYSARHVITTALPRLIGRFDITKPDTVANRLAAYWQDVTTLARDFFRF